MNAKSRTYAGRVIVRWHYQATTKASFVDDERDMKIL